MARALTPHPWAIRDLDGRPLAVIVAKTMAEARDHYLQEQVKIARIDAVAAFRIAESTTLPLTFAKPEYDLTPDAQQELPL